ncbi:Pre-mRNA-splicing factor cwc26 [Coemansia erecta]|nr:Pre-mRNA-splicing factor cwc26 [Coemansia erecta]
MSLKDYLAKHYGAAPDGSSTEKTKKKSKKQQQPKSHQQSSFGINVVIDEDHDAAEFASLSNDPTASSAHSPNPDSASSISKPNKKEVFKPIESTWKQVLGSKNISLKNNNEVDQEEEDERPVIAQGAELIDEYNLRRQKEHELQMQQHKQKTREIKQAHNPRDSEKQQKPARSPSPEPAKRYGLLTAQEIREDNEKIHERYLRQMKDSSDNSGKDADTIYRDPKTGKKLDIEKIDAENTEKKQREKELRKQQIEWNKGLVQQRERIQSHNLIQSMRVAGNSSSNDVAQMRDAENRARMHWDDPALQFLENKKPERTRFPVYKGYAPPNRFNIRPGYRWDGVDRSNGFEAEYFKRQAASSARQAESYASSVADW